MKSIEYVNSSKIPTVFRIFTFYDYTDLKQNMIDKLGKSYRTMYYTSIAHDIKTPINGLKATNAHL
jgi:hypothetical protein